MVGDVFRQLRASPASRRSWFGVALFVGLGAAPPAPRPPDQPSGVASRDVALDDPDDVMRAMRNIEQGRVDDVFQEVTRLIGPPVDFDIHDVQEALDEFVSDDRLRRLPNVAWQFGNEEPPETPPGRWVYELPRED
jgi:hypothetical protein